MGRKTTIYGLTGFVFTLLGFVGKTVYRDFVYSNDIQDFGFGGFLPSYFYVAGFALLLLMGPVKHFYPKIVILTVTLASILFELRQYSSTGIFDIKDVLASLAGGITALLCVKWVESSYKA